MTTSEIGDAIANAVAYLSQHPSEAEYIDSAATAVLEDSLRATVTGPDGAKIVADMPKSIGGRAESPSPGWFLRAGQASCLAILIAMEAAKAGVTLDRVEVVVDSESDDRGILGMDERTPAGPFNSRARATVRAAGVPPPELNAIVERADRHCPVQDAVRRAVPCSVEIV